MPGGVHATEVAWVQGRLHQFLRSPLHARWHALQNIHACSCSACEARHPKSIGLSAYAHSNLEDVRLIAMDSLPYIACECWETAGEEGTGIRGRTSWGRLGATWPMRLRHWSMLWSTSCLSCGVRQPPPRCCRRWLHAVMSSRKNSASRSARLLFAPSTACQHRVATQ